VGLQRPGQARITAGGGLSGGRISHHDQGVGHHPMNGSAPSAESAGAPPDGGSGITRQARLKVSVIQSTPVAALRACCNGTMKFLNNR